MNNQDAGGHGRSQVSREAILAHFRNRPTRARGRHRRDSVHYLMRLILDHRDFNSLESLIEYCKNHDNLRPWLLREADRVIFSTELVRGLHDMV
ncbi:MAG: hypothetical protein JSU86_14060 [Phycisphaerales bacterium]|nr:MAG: hypothetical protein JSU86_14060 [Phycisphaerales bacterium]